MADVRDEVRAYMQAEGLGHKRMADELTRVGYVIDQGTLHRLLSGKHQPRQGTIAAVSQALKKLRKETS